MYHLTWKSAEEAGATGGNVLNLGFASEAAATAAATALSAFVAGDLMSVTADVTANRDRSSYPAFTGLIEAGLLLTADGSEHWRLANVAPTGCVRAALKSLADAGTLKSFGDEQAVTAVIAARR